MNKQELIDNIIILVNRYIPNRDDLIELIKNDIDSVKYIMSEIDKNKSMDYLNEDLELLKDIAFYYL
ncbi:MAG: hypothetical protein IIT65_11415 [Lachnospiraceae bacterium]|nr:hypothetical protein [Lachnospiraceae bacterium]